MYKAPNRQIPPTMIRILRTTDFPGLIVRLVVGLVFLSEGLQKFLYPETLGSGRFEKLGIHPATFWAPFTGAFEIVCGLLIAIGLVTRLAVVPLLVIMAVAFVTTKWPEMMEKGFWAMAHDGRTDFVMTLLLVFLFIYRSGKPSVDYTKYERGKKN
jgi:putative oxidoreductase